jgi:hypothetical protein
MANSQAHTLSQLNLREMWNFSDPVSSQVRFEAALAGASADDALILRTQIARAMGLRKDIAGARELLRSIEPQAAAASPRVQAHHALEWGRTFASAVHDLKTLSDADKREASQAFERAQRIAQQHLLDALAIDAIHMFAFVDESPTAAEAIARKALVISLNSAQPDAQRWQASIRHNLGYALQQQARYTEALVEFATSQALRAKANNADGVRVAQWMQARVLRLMGRSAEALAMQEALLIETQALGKPDPYAVDELILLYTTVQLPAQAEAMKQLRSKL